MREAGQWNFQEIQRLVGELALNAEYNRLTTLEAVTELEQVKAQAEADKAEREALAPKK